MQFQTIKMRIAEISECVNDNNEFIPTNFDELVNDFIQSLFDDNMFPDFLTTSFNGEHAVAHIRYRPAAAEEIQAIQMMKEGKQPKLVMINTEGLQPPS